MNAKHTGFYQAFLKFISKDVTREEIQRTLTFFAVYLEAQQNVFVSRGLLKPDDLDAIMQEFENLMVKLAAEQQNA